MHSRVTTIFFPNLMFYCSSTAKRPRSRWEDTTEMDLGEMEYTDVEWTELANIFKEVYAPTNILSTNLCVRLS
jgi:hypothetical protein